MAVGASTYLGGAGTAAAYTIDTQITEGCHESISAAALRSVRTSTGWGAPMPSSLPDDGPIIDDLPFHAPEDFKDIGGATLLLGARDNDLKSLPATSLDQLAQATSDPATQREHCLRSDKDKEPGGSAQAVANCRAFIKEKLVSSLDGLGPDGKPDGSIRDSLHVSLALRGKIDISVPAFYLRAGQAIHAIQDSFTHTFRDAADQHKISVALDWIDYANNNLNEAVDGPPHMSQLDRCDDPDALRTQKHHLAIEASTAALKIALDPTLSPAAKATAFDQMLDTYVVYDGTGGCTFANNWCNAPENQYRPAGCGCIGAGAGDAGALRFGGLAALAALAGVAVRRRARPSRPRRQPLGGVGVALVVMTLMSVPRGAFAQGKPAGGNAPDNTTTGPIAALSGESRAGTLGKRDPAGALFGHVGIGASYDHAALAGSLGAKYQLSRNWMVGLDAEWNPWIPIDPLGLRAGTANLYGSIIRRYQMAYESLNFRTTAALGVCRLLMDLPGAPKGGMGPMFGISFLGIEYKMTPGFFLVVDPTYLIFDVPHLSGTPLVYYQYRFQIALEFGG